jgi:hypothetical protein
MVLYQMMEMVRDGVVPHAGGCVDGDGIVPQAGGCVDGDGKKWYCTTFRWPC